MTNDRIQARLENLVELITKNKHLFATSLRVSGWMREYDIIKMQHPLVWQAHCNNGQYDKHHDSHDLLA